MGGEHQRCESVVGVGQMGRSTGSALGVVGAGLLAGSSGSSLGVVEVGEIGGNEVIMVAGEENMVELAPVFGKAPFAERLPAAKALDHGNDTEKSWAWWQSTSEPTTNVKKHYDQLLRLNGLITPNTSNVALFNPIVADVIFTVANAAHSSILKFIRDGLKLSRWGYVMEIDTGALENSNSRTRPHS